MSEETKEPPEIALSVEFDNCYTDPWRVEMRSDNLEDVVVIRTDKGLESTVFSAYRDQWGVFVDIGDISVAQEDGTRSFLDAMIKCLQKLRDRNEFKTKESTILTEVKP